MPFSAMMLADGSTLAEYRSSSQFAAASSNSQSPTVGGYFPNPSQLLSISSKINEGNACVGPPTDKSIGSPPGSTPSINRRNRANGYCGSSENRSGTVISASLTESSRSVDLRVDGFPDSVHKRVCGHCRRLGAMCHFCNPAGRRTRGRQLYPNLSSSALPIRNSFASSKGCASSITPADATPVGKVSAGTSMRFAILVFRSAIRFRSA